MSAYEGQALASRLTSGSGTPTWGLRIVADGSSEAGRKASTDPTPGGCRDVVQPTVGTSTQELAGSLGLPMLQPSGSSLPFSSRDPCRAAPMQRYTDGKQAGII